MRSDFLFAVRGQDVAPIPRPEQAGYFPSSYARGREGLAGAHLFETRRSAGRSLHAGPCSFWRWSGGFRRP